MHNVFHLSSHDFFDLLRLLDRTFNDQFIVNLQNKTCLEFLLSERSVNTDHGQLDNISCRTLNGRVKRNALTEGTNIEVAAFEFLQLAAAAEKCGHIAITFCLLDNFVHISSDACIMCQIIVNILPRFLACNANVF